MARTRWIPFASTGHDFEFAGDRLKSSWAALHEGDREPFPDAKWAAAAIASAPQPRIKLTPAALAMAAQDAWRAFHRGDFGDAFDRGDALGVWGASLASRAQAIHATRLVQDPKQQAGDYLAAAERAAIAADAWPAAPNTHYQHAYSLGRYSQAISIAQALSQGLAGKVKTSLDATLERAPKHAEAMLALSLYHAEIVSKVGKLIAGLTYGAKAATAEALMTAALKLGPKSPIAHIEHGNMLLALHGDKREDEAAAAYGRAAALPPRDAMEALDAAYAQSQIE